MAELKSKKPADDQKITDVKQGGDAASGTSRQIILNNRPIMKDPMMAEVSELANAQAGIKSADETEVPGAPVVTRKAKTIAVIHEDSEAEASASEAAKEPKKDPKTPKTAPKPADAKPVAPKKVEIEAVEEPAEPKPKPEPVVKEPGPKAEDPAPAGVATDEPKPVTSTKAEPEPTDPKPEAAAPDEPTADKPEEAKDGLAGEKATGGLQPGRSFDETESPAAPTDDSTTEEEAKDGKSQKPQLQPGELTPEQQKAYDKGQYFLPIITAETRRTRLEIILAVVFIVIVLAVWLDIMLDAGLLHISGVQPLTHFFKS